MLSITNSIKWLEKKKSPPLSHPLPSPTRSFTNILREKKRQPMTDFIKKYQLLSTNNKKMSMQQKRQFIQHTREIELLLVEQRLPSIDNELERRRLLGELRYLQSIL